MSISLNIMKKLTEDIKDSEVKQNKLLSKYKSLLIKLRNYDETRYKVPYSTLVKQMEELESELKQMGLSPRSYMNNYVLKGSSPDIEQENKEDEIFLKQYRRN